MKKYYKESRRRGISYKQYKDGRLTGLVTSCVGSALKNLDIKGKVEGRGRQGMRC
jgi:predicted transcriptional regulator